MIETETTQTESQLLREFILTGSSTVFTQLVAPHTAWVYSVALRRVGDVHLAEDVLQAVFLILSRKAKSLNPNRSISPWLFNVTRNCCAQANADKNNRRKRESEAARMKPEQTNPSEADIWEDISSMLDDLVGHLRFENRQAVLLRFYEQKSLSEVGAALGISEEAAKKRVSRAIEKLRVLFGRRGVTLGAAGLSTLLIAKVSSASPPQMPPTFTTQAATHSTLTIAKGAIFMAAATKIKFGLLALFILLICGAGGVFVWKVAAQMVPTSQPQDTQADQAALPAIQSDLVVSGTVKDPQGKVVPNAEIGLPPGTGFGVHSNLQGHFLIKVEAKYLPIVRESILIVRDPGKNLAVAVNISASTQDLAVTLKPAHTIRGKLLDPDGNPVANRDVNLSLFPDHVSWWAAGFFGDKSVSDEQGNFEFDAMPVMDGYRYVLHVKGIRYRIVDKPQTIDMTAPEGQPIDIGTTVVPAQ